MNIQSIISKHDGLDGYSVDHIRNDVNIYYLGQGMKLEWYNDLCNVINSKFALCFQPVAAV